MKKLAVSLESMKEAAANVETKVRGGGQGEVPTSIIGEYAAEELRKIDKVAYVRFASVYREFTDISSFTINSKTTGGQGGIVMANDALHESGSIFGKQGKIFQRSKESQQILP